MLLLEFFLASQPYAAPWLPTSVGRQYCLLPRPPPPRSCRLSLVVGVPSPTITRPCAAPILPTPCMSAAAATVVDPAAAAVASTAASPFAAAPRVAVCRLQQEDPSLTRACCGTQSTDSKQEPRFASRLLLPVALLLTFFSSQALRAPAAVAAAAPWLPATASSVAASPPSSACLLPPALLPSSAFAGTSCTAHPADSECSASTSSASLPPIPQTLLRAVVVAARSSSTPGCSSRCGWLSETPRAARVIHRCSSQQFFTCKKTSGSHLPKTGNSSSSKDVRSSSGSNTSKTIRTACRSSQVGGGALLCRIPRGEFLHGSLPSSGTSGRIFSRKETRTSRCTPVPVTPLFVDSPSHPRCLLPSFAIFALPKAGDARHLTAVYTASASVAAVVAPHAAAAALRAAPPVVAACRACAGAAGRGHTPLVSPVASLTLCMCGAWTGSLLACGAAAHSAVARSYPPFSYSLPSLFAGSSGRLPSPGGRPAVWHPPVCPPPAVSGASAAAAAAFAAAVVPRPRRGVQATAGSSSAAGQPTAAAVAAARSQDHLRPPRTALHALLPRTRALAASSSFSGRHSFVFTAAASSGAGTRPLPSVAAVLAPECSPPTSAASPPSTAAAALPHPLVTAATAPPPLSARLHGSLTASAARGGIFFAAGVVAAAAVPSTKETMGHSTEPAADDAGAPAAAAAVSEACQDAAGGMCSSRGGAGESSSAGGSAAAQGGENDIEGGAATSKKAQKKKEKEAAKAAAQKAKREAQVCLGGGLPAEAEQRAAQAILQKKVDDPTGKETFGYLPLTWKSPGGAPRVWSSLGSLQQLLAENQQHQQKREGAAAAGGATEKEGAAVRGGDNGLVVWVRGRLQESRGKGGLAFLLLREKGATVQCVLDAKHGEISKEMIKWTMSLPLESIVDVEGVVVPAAVTVQAATEQQIELLPRRVYCVSAAAQVLPFQFKDASRSAEEGSETMSPAPSEAAPRVALDTRLDHRVLDLRTAASQAVFSVVSAAAALFREFLLQQHFVELHSPKLIAGASEGGASCFTLQYFGRDACLAQSPQLYKQMAICGDFPRVFEIGPVFRAENSNTHRHLCEFTGVDLEMEIKEDYTEVLDLLDGLFKHVFAGLEKHCKKEIAAFHAQYPAKPFVWQDQTPRLTFAEGVQLLRAAGCSGIPDDISAFDLNTEQEKMLGRIVKEKYNTDFYMLLQYPTKVRPFYTMPSPENPEFSNSYDLFMRTEEIISGAQRVHDADLLTKRCVECNVPPASIQTYIDAFRLGAPPHGGAGIGLERVVMLFLGAKNIRQVSLFPRDPKRLTP